MKKLAFALMGFMVTAYANNTYAQSDTIEYEKDSKVVEVTKEVATDVKEGVQEGVHEIKEVGKDVGHKTAETTMKTIAEIKDKKLKNRVGPNGQAIYEDRYNNYYWVNERGRKIYLTEAKLKEK